jgi:hypothetical protein
MYLHRDADELGQWELRHEVDEWILSNELACFPLYVSVVDDVFASRRNLTNVKDRGAPRVLLSRQIEVREEAEDLCTCQHTAP